jgi:2'-5' RNA ligase
VTAYAVTLCLDDATNALVTTLLQGLADGGIDDDRLRLGYRAHVTLAVFPEDAPAASIDAVLCAIAPAWSALPVELVGFGVFPTARPVLFLAPVVTAELLGRHAALFDALPAMRCDPHYRPGAWVPHVTLGSTMSVAAALAALLPLWKGPIAGHFTQVELLRFRPVGILRSIPLTASPIEEGHV